MSLLFPCLVLSVTAAGPTSLNTAQLGARDLAPECQSGPAYDGTLHAATSFSTPGLDPSGGKVQHSVVCQGGPAVIYLYDYGAQIGQARTLFAARLWGGPAPTGDPDESDDLLTRGSVLAVVSGPGAKAITGKLVSKGFVAAASASPGSVAARFKAEVSCETGPKDALRSWCPVTRVEEASFQAPAAPQTFVGITVALRPGAKVRDALLQNVTVSAVSFAGGRVQVRGIKPDNEKERQQLLAVAGGVANILKGAKGPLKVEADFAQYLSSLTRAVAARGYPIAPSQGGAHFAAQNPSTAYRVEDPSAGPVYIVVEEAPDGTWINLYPAVAFVGG
jgi:hypothetical protein